MCVFGSICLLNGENISNSLNYSSKTILKGHKAHSLELHQKCSNFSLSLFCCWVSGMVDASNLCLCGSHFFKEQNSLSNLSYSPNLCFNNGQSSVIKSASKMIYLSAIFVAKKGQYSPICVTTSFFATNGKIPIKL